VLSSQSTVILGTEAAVWSWAGAEIRSSRSSSPGLTRWSLEAAGWWPGRARPLRNWAGL